MDHELNFRDSISYLLTSACRPGRCIELHVAEALGRFFITCPLYVIWGSTDSSRSLVGVRRDVDHAAQLMTKEELDGVLASLPDVSSERPYEQLVIIRIYETEGAPRAIELLDPTPLGRDRFLLVLGKTPGLAAERVGFFKNYLQGQRELYAVVKALHSSARLAEWSGEVERLISCRQAPFLARLAKSSRMVEEMSREPTPEMMELIQRLAIWAVHQLLGTGWRVRRMEGCSDQLQALSTHLRAAAERWKERTSGADEALGGQLRCLADMLDAETIRRSLHEGAPFRVRHGGSDAVELLRTWTLMHELARSVCRKDIRDHKAAFRTWFEVIKGARPSLLRFLESSFERAQERAARFRNWLRLWFCQEIWCDLSDDEMAEKELTSFPPWRWRADFAYVLREGLRFECFGDRPEYRVQPDALAESLRTLVEYHAIGVAGVSPAFSVNWILSEIAEVPRADEYHFCAGHLQHVVETYIVGHFFCSMVVSDAHAAPGVSVDGWTIAELLASLGSERDSVRTAELKQAFSIAALFHDVGMILFPRHHALRETLVMRDERLKEHLLKVDGVVGRAGADVSNICVKDLIEGGYIDHTRDATLARWMAEQEDRPPGKPDHALLGAWYLHRLCEPMEGAMREVARQALRSIILHQVMKYRIDAAADPAAALLVLCDEIFEWDPYMRGVPVHNAMISSLHTMAVEVEPHPSRARRITIQGLTVRATVDGNVVVSLPREANPPFGWPQIEVELKHLELLDVKVYQHWLTMAQNLGRVTSHRGFGPTVKVTSQAPPWPERVGGHREVLQQALQLSKHPIAPKLRTWLSEPNRFSKDESWETVYLGPIKKEKAFDHDVRDYLLDLEVLVRLVLTHNRQIHHSSYPPPSDDSEAPDPSVISKP